MEITVRCSQLFPILQLQQIFRNCKMLVNLNYHEVGNKKKLTILCIYTYVDCNLEYVFAKNGQGYERTLISLYFDSFFFFATSAMLSQGQRLHIVYIFFSIYHNQKQFLAGGFVFLLHTNAEQEEPQWNEIFFDVAPNFFPRIFQGNIVIEIKIEVKYGNIMQNTKVTMD